MCSSYCQKYNSKFDERKLSDLTLFQACRISQFNNLSVFTLDGF